MISLEVNQKNDYLNKLLSFNLKKTNEGQIINKIFEKLSKDIDKYYIDHLKGSITFVLREDKQQQGKSDLFTTILNIEKKHAREKNKANIAKLKNLKRRYIKMLKNLGEEYVEIEDAW